MSFSLFPIMAHSGTIALAPLPGRFSSLAQDVAQIAAWRPALVVSLTQADEMRASGASDLGALLAERGIAWAHFPIPDFGVPSAGSAEWSALSARLHGALNGGGRVLLHCYGGRGRSGMIALRLMVESGCSPETALRRVRDVRPGAVETDAQFEWAAAGQKG